MGLLDNSSITVNAILTTRGREMLSRGGDLNITKFALSDEEIDYTMYDMYHSAGTDSFGVLLENIPILEATPNRSKLNSYLMDNSQESSEILISTLNYPRAHWTVIDSTIPTTVGTAEEEAEDYTFTIENTNIVKHISNPSANTITGQSTTLRAQSINPGGTTTITVTGLVSGIVNIVTVAVKKTEASSNPPDGTQQFEQDKDSYQQQS